MAKQMAHTDASGNSYTASYWRVVQVNIGIADKSASVLFYGYKDDAARQSGKVNIGQKLYGLFGDKVTEYFGASVLDTANPMEQAYKLTMDTLDTNGKSFFEGALDV
jgi:hypothetical protein